MPADRQSKTDEIRERLVARRTELGAEVREGQARLQNEDMPSLDPSEVGDAGDASVARDTNDIRQAEVERDANEIEAIDFALRRIESGEYGRCMDCDEDIPLARLQAAPTAARCLACQTRFEARIGQPSGHTI